MKKKACLTTAIFLTSILPISQTFADDDRDEERNRVCNGSAPAILSVADFDGNGVVNNDDIVLIKKARKREIYYAFYDINADGKLDKRDVRQAYSELGSTSTATDRMKATLFHQISQYQLTDSKQEMRASVYQMIAPSLAGHGEHWVHGIPNMNHESPYLPGGINYSMDDNEAKGVFWSVDAVPVFENGATDYPTPGGEWMNSQVVKFANMPPKFTDSHEEVWHTHAGLCVTAQMGANGPEPVLNQHTTFLECQSLPTLFKTGGNINVWFNVWMLHGWIFDLNPNGFFANTHACLDVNSPSEETINGGRNVPPFFQMHHGHEPM